MKGAYNVMVLTKENLIECLSHMEKFCDILKEIPTTEEECKKRLSELNLEEQDLLHEIEFMDLSRSERSVTCLKLKDLRKTRRMTKELQEILDVLVKFRLKNVREINHINMAVSRMKEIIKLQGERVYYPRFRSDMKLIKVQGLKMVRGEDGRLKAIEK